MSSSRTWRRSWSRESVVTSQNGCLGARAHTEFRKNSRQGVAHGLVADEQRGRDLGIALPRHDGREDLPFPRRQRCQQRILHPASARTSGEFEYGVLEVRPRGLVGQENVVARVERYEL